MSVKRTYVDSESFDEVIGAISSIFLAITEAWSWLHCDLVVMGLYHRNSLY